MEKNDSSTKGTSKLVQRNVKSEVLGVPVGLKIRILFDGFPVWLIAMDKSLCHCVHFPQFKNLKHLLDSF